MRIFQLNLLWSHFLLHWRTPCTFFLTHLNTQGWQHFVSNDLPFTSLKDTKLGILYYLAFRFNIHKYSPNYSNYIVRYAVEIVKRVRRTLSTPRNWSRTFFWCKFLCEMINTGLPQSIKILFASGYVPLQFPSVFYFLATFVHYCLDDENSKLLVDLLFKCSL